MSSRLRLGQSAFSDLCILEEVEALKHPSMRPNRCKMHALGQREEPFSHPRENVFWEKTQALWRPPAGKMLWGRSMSRGEVTTFYPLVLLDRDVPPG